NACGAEHVVILIGNRPHAFKAAGVSRDADHALHAGIPRALNHRLLVSGEFREIEVAMGVDELHGIYLAASAPASTKRGNNPCGAGSGVPLFKLYSAVMCLKSRSCDGKASCSNNRFMVSGMKG